MCIARSSTHKNVRRRRRRSWQRSSMPLSSAVLAWFAVSGHDLLLTAGLRSCAIARLRTSSSSSAGQCRSASSWPSACPCIVFAVHCENVCLPPIHCKRWPLVICLHLCAAHGQSRLRLCSLLAYPSSGSGLATILLCCNLGQVVYSHCFQSSQLQETGGTKGSFRNGPI